MNISYRVELDLYEVEISINTNTVHLTQNGSRRTLHMYSFGIDEDNILLLVLDEFEHIEISLVKLCTRDDIHLYLRCTYLVEPDMYV